jgi:hypothetical protein
MLLGNNLGLLRDAAYAQEFLGALASLAAPGARVLGTCLDPYGTAEPLHVRYHARNREAGRMGGQIRLRFRHRDLASEWMDWLFASPAELRELTDGSAWKVSDRYGAWSRSTGGRRGACRG